MTNDDRIQLLQEAVDTHGSQAKVARMLGYSSATISQVLGGKYAGELDSFLTKVEETFGKAIYDCPILGEISHPQCVLERRTPFFMANPHRVRMFKACRTCIHNTDPLTND